MALFLIVIVILADTRHLGPLAVLYDFQHGDKAGHFVLFGGLAMLINVAAILVRRDPSARVVLPATAVLGVVITLEEFSQLFLPSRSPDAFDLLAGYAGVITGALLALYLNQASGGSAPGSGAGVAAASRRR